MGRTGNLGIIQIKVSRRTPLPLPPVLVKQTDSHVSLKFVLLGFCRQHGPVHAHNVFTPVSSKLVSRYKIKKCMLWSPFTASLGHRDFMQLGPAAAGHFAAASCRGGCRWAAVPPHRAVPAAQRPGAASGSCPARSPSRREVRVMVLWATVPWVTVP